MYEWDTKLIFARKIVPQFGPIAAGTVQNEVRAVSKLCMSTTHRNIVEVLRHGSSPDGSHYFFDMELCDWTLQRVLDTPRTPR